MLQKLKLLGKCIYIFMGILWEFYGNFIGFFRDFYGFLRECGVLLGFAMWVFWGRELGEGMVGLGKYVNIDS